MLLILHSVGQTFMSVYFSGLPPPLGCTRRVPPLSTACDIYTEFRR